MRKLLPFVFLFYCQIVNSQVTIILDSVPKFFTPLFDTIFLTVTRDSKSIRLPFIKKDGKLQVNLPKEGEDITFFISRGDSTTMEFNSAGSKIESRSYSFKGKPDTLRIVVAAWLDWPQKQHSISGSVNLLKTTFYSRQLKHNLRVWIRLPSGYNNSNQRYPVLYMNDGQNLFDDATSYAGEWGVDETLETLENLRDSGLIVVGIETNQALRINECAPWKNSDSIGGVGEDYATFIVTSLKPFIDKSFRTKPDNLNNGIAGSSMGAIISFYIALKYPNVFSRCGLFSPSFWFSDEAYNLPRLVGVNPNSRFYMVCGVNEGDNAEINMRRMCDTLLANGGQPTEMICLSKPDGRHSEWFWKREFSDAYKFLYYGRLPGNFEYDFPDSKELTISPLPAKDFLIVTYTFRLSERFRIVLNNESGMDFTFDPKDIRNLGEKRLMLDISKLERGSYFVVFINDRKTYYRRFVKQ